MNLGAKVQRAYVGLLTPLGLAGTLTLQLVMVLVVSWLGPASEIGDGSAAGVIWQVHAAFASIGFAGLAIAFQVLGDPPLSAGSARQAVVTDMRFGPLLFSGVAASGVIGIVTLWLANPGTLAVSFVFVLAPSVLIVGAAYARLATLFTSTQRVEGLTLAELKVRVRNAAAKAAKQEQSDRETERRIDGARGLTSGSLPSRTGLGTRRVQNHHYRGVVTSVDIGPMVFAADHLGWAAHEGAHEVGLATYEYPQRISVRARPGKQYRPGDTLFEMHAWPGIDEADWEAISRQLLSGLRFSDDQSGDASVVFAEDMSALQDSVLAAVRDHQIARVGRGYLYYQETIHEARGSTGATHLGLKDPRWFERQLGEIDSAAARSTGRMAFVAIADAERMAYDAVRTQDLPWLRSSLLRLQRIWSLLPTTEETGALYARENLLVSLQNLGEFAIPYSFSDAGAAFASRQLIWSFVSIAKNSIDVGDVTTAERVLGYMGGLYDTGPRETSEQLGVEVAVGQAAVLGWILFSRERNRHDPPYPVSLDGFPRRHYPPDMVLVLRAYETYRDEAPWAHWETEGALPLRVHVLEFERYFRQAVLLLAANGRLRLRSSTVRVEDRYLLQDTRASSSAIERHWSTDEHDELQLEPVLTHIDRLLEQMERDRNELLASAPLSSSRVAVFHRSIIDTMQSAPRLATFLQISPLSGPPDDQGLIGQILRGLPRDFFVESDVIASPSELGHQVAAAVLRNQDLGILTVLLAEHSQVELTSDGLQESIHQFAEPLTDPVLIYNGQSTIEEVLTVDFLEDGGVTLAGYPAFAMYVGDTAFPGDVILVDRDSVSDFDFLPEDKEDLTKLPEAQLAVGILEEPVEQGIATLTIEYGQVGRWVRGNPSVTPIRVIQ